MLKQLQSLAVFAAVVETGTFTNAARKLKLTNSVVSHHVSKLEDTLGVTLLYRSTRRQSLTEDGRRVYEAARKMVRAAEVMLDDVSQSAEEPVGTLNITMPAFMPEAWIERAVWSFVQKHRGVDVSLQYSDVSADLIAGGFDVAFRLGLLPPSSLKAMHVADAPIRLVGSPDLLARHNPIRDPQDLLQVDHVTIDGSFKSITLRSENSETTITPESYRVRVNSIYAGHSAALEGIGLMKLPVSLCATDLAEGRLVEALPGWVPPPIPIRAVWPSQARRNSLTRRFLDHVMAQRGRDA